MKKKKKKIEYNFWFNNQKKEKEVIPGVIKRRDGIWLLLK